MSTAQLERLPGYDANAPWLENPVLKQRIRFPLLPAATGGATFVIEYTFEPRAGRTAVPPHFHTTVHERFEVLSGRARYRTGSREGTAEPGEVIEMPAGEVHMHPWSDSDEPLHIRQTASIDPPDRAGAEAGIHAAITILGFARDGRVDAKGFPGMLPLSILLLPSMPATYIAGPPPWVQRAMFGVLSRVATVFGYRRFYPRYGGIVDGRFVPPAA